MTDIKPLSDVESYNQGYRAGRAHTIEEDYKIQLRDQLAMAALTGLVINNSGIPENKENIAYAAYKYADAMLAERGKK